MRIPASGAIMPYDVFISHSSKDKNAADAVCAVLERNAVRCWIAPRDVLPGTPWGSAIVAAIHGAKIMVLVFSRSANTSPQIEREVERAISHGIPVIPFRIEDVQPSHSLEYFISASHWLDAFTPPIEQHLERLASVVRQILEAQQGNENSKPDADAAKPSPDAKPSALAWQVVAPPPASAPSQNRPSRTPLMIAAVALCIAGAALGGLAFQWAGPAKTPSHRVGEFFRDCAGCPEMVVVPPGRFMMGAGEQEQSPFAGWAEWERPVHEVRIAQAFAVGVYPVTRDEFSEFIRQTGHPMDGGCHYWNGQDRLDPTRSFRDPKNPGGPQAGDHPVVCVSLRDAKEYTVWLSGKTGRRYRLLSDAEREYVARAGTTTAFWWGPSISPDQANYSSEQSYGGSPTAPPRGTTLPVKFFQPNPWGLYQVHGNISEMVADCWFADYVGAPVDGSVRKDASDSDCRNVTVRSGSFINHPSLSRSAQRRSFSIVREVSLGFRVAQTLSD
jgi:formylglycine-generating enzyme required for sulfatase activity